MKNSFARTICISIKFYVFIQLYTLFSSFNKTQRHITGDNMLPLSKIFFNAVIFNVCIRCIWLNVTYIMSNLFRTTLQCDFAIGPRLFYNKWAFIRRFIYLGIIISEHDFISKFIVMVKSFTISTDIIFIDLRLLFQI